MQFSTSEWLNLCMTNVVEVCLEERMSVWISGRNAEWVEGLMKRQIPGNKWLA